MMSILLYSFIFFFDIARATCAVNVDEDVIFLLDFSTSMSEEDFEVMKQFAARLTRETLPDNARVACLGFGEYPVTFFDFHVTYDHWGTPSDIPDDADREWFANEIIETAFYYEGSTNLGRAILAIINGDPTYFVEPVIDAESLCCRKTLLIIMTDGIATDLLGPVREDLFATNTKTVVVGIGNQFVPHYMLEIVDSANDIHKVDSFAELTNVYDTLRTYICEADIEIAVTEFKVQGDKKFVEIMNLGRKLRTEELLMVSNVLEMDNYTFPESTYNVSTGDLIVLHEPGVNVARCAVRNTGVNETNCLAFETSFVQNNDTFNNTWGWEIHFKQVEVTGRRERRLLSTTQLSDITSAQLLASTLNLDPIRTDYSYERKVSPLGDSQSISANWKESCSRYGSPGDSAEQFGNCVVRCDREDKCGEFGSCEIQDDGQFGCTCPDIGFKTLPYMCDPIPQPKSCRVEGTMPVGVTPEDTNSKFLASIVWEPADDPTIGGHQFTWGQGGRSAADFRGTVSFFEIYGTYSDFNTTSILTVGEQECFYFTGADASEQLVCNVISTSDVFNCENQLQVQKTSPPSRTPSRTPSKTPSSTPSKPPQFSTPTVTVFLAEWTGENMTETDEDTGKRVFKEVHTTSEKELIVTLRIYGTSDSYETLVKYGLYERHSGGGNDTLLQVGSHTFPPAALYVADTFEINFGKTDMLNGAILEKRLRFKLFENEEQDQFGRPLYNLIYPSEADILVSYEAPFVATETEAESLPWWIYPAIGAGVFIIILIATYFVCLFRKRTAAAQKRRDEAEEDVRRIEDGFFTDTIAVIENPLRELQLNHKKKETLSLNDNVEMITYDDDETFDMRTNHNFSQQVAYTTTSGYTSEGLPRRLSLESRIPHRKLTSDQDPNLRITGHPGAAPEEGLIRE